MKNKSIVLWTVAILSPVMVIIWQLLLREVSWYVISAAVLLLSVVPFLFRFEQRKVTARETALLATLIALAVVSRAAFFLVPQVKPVAAVVIVSAACLGAESGYIIGVFTAFISNFIFGQGLWTPYQMFALGMVGLIAGLLFYRKQTSRLPSLRFRFLLSAVGFLLAFAVYGLLVDISTILVTYGNHVTVAGVLSVYAAGIPFSLLFGASTAVFLFLFGETFIRKVNRILVKYALISPSATPSGGIGDYHNDGGTIQK